MNAFVQSFLKNLPEVQAPTQKRLPFNDKLRWSAIILVIYFVLGAIPLYGLGGGSLQQFEFLSIILGASFGSILSLGIGPLVTSSIVLQLLVGAGLLKIDLTKPEGKQFFQGLQKLLSIFFIIFEAGIYIFMGGLTPDPSLAGTSTYFSFQLLLIGQLFLGGILVMFMDEVISKWGFGSGISLFIAAGVSQSIFIQLLSPFDQQGAWALFVDSGQLPVGRLWEFIMMLTTGTAQGITDLLSPLLPIFSTIFVFVVAVYFQAMRVEIPLSFGRVRGHGIRWPLRFLYTSNIPVILVAALLANIQLLAQFVENAAANSSSAVLNFISLHILGSSQTGGGLVGVIYGGATRSSGGLLGLMLTRGVFGVGGEVYLQALVYVLIMIVGSIIFGWFWVQTSGMDAESQAKQMMSSGLQIPGFRKDKRILERLLKRYITPLTIMGSIAVGFLAAAADLTGSLSRGTGILLAVMIVFNLYEEIVRQHMMDMHPMMRKFMKG